MLEYDKISVFTEFQTIRYGYYRSSDLRKDKVKKILSGFSPLLKNINSSDPLVISLKGIAKLFIGEMIEISKQIMFEKNEDYNWINDPIKPSDLVDIFENQEIKPCSVIL